MSTKRLRKSGSWEFVVRRKTLFDAPLYLSFGTEAEGDEYVTRLEALLDKGIVPAEFSRAKAEMANIGDVIRKHLSAQQVSASDRSILKLLNVRIGSTSLVRLDYEWAESWVTRLKRAEHLSPTTIRHYVGALARSFDLAERHGVASLIPNPLRKLPRNYSIYNYDDVAAVRALGHMPGRDVERDRRLDPAEEARIRRILAGETPKNKQRSFDLHWQAALECIFELALESAMRMREMYTLSPDQVDFTVKTCFLDKTKNGDKRQVPLTSVAIKALRTYIKQVKKQERRMQGFTLRTDRLFPWWDGQQASLKKTTSLLSRQFARVFAAVGCVDLRFHDLRHEATSRLFEKTKLSDIQISRITGHKDPRVLRRYANLRGSDLANQLW